MIVKLLFFIHNTMAKVINTLFQTFISQVSKKIVLLHPEKGHSLLASKKAQDW